MAERVEVVRCQVADASIDGEKAVLMLVFPEGGNPRKCTCFPGYSPADKGQDDAIEAVAQGKVRAGQWRDFTIRYKPAGKGEFRNVLRMSEEESAPAGSPPPAPAPVLGAPKPTWRTKPEEETESIERNTALKEAVITVTEVMKVYGTPGEPVGLSPYSSMMGGIAMELAERYAAFIHKQVWSGEAGSEPAPVAPEAAPEPPAPEPEVFDPESMRQAVLDAAGGSGVVVNEAIATLGLPAFLEMSREQVEHLIDRLATSAASF